MISLVMKTSSSRTVVIISAHELNATIIKNDLQFHDVINQTDKFYE